MAKYFKPAEFGRCTPSCKESDLQPAFVSLLDQLRERAGIPLVLNSCYRSPEWEKAYGRTGTSAHCLGLAADIRCSSPENRYKIVKAALDLGVTRIGISKTYVHVDVSRKHAQRVIWDYYGS